MSCFPCFRNKDDNTSPPSEDENDNVRKKGGAGSTVNASNVDPSHINAKGFTFRELASATSNFRQSQLLGEGGFGRVYKGTIQSTGQVVAVKQLDRSMQEQNQFLFEVYRLSLLHHENLVELIGYCADGDQRLLVHEFMSGGSLQTHLYENKKSLDWFTRLKIAYGAAQGMEYLHEKTNPPVIYRDMKAANVLLDREFNPKLSDFGLTNLGPNNGADKIPPGSRVVGTYGYSAPEYTRTGEVTLKSDVFSFGVVLLELITGRKAVDTTKPSNQQNLVSWAQTYFKEPKKFPLLADPVLEGWFPERSLNQTVAIFSMCLQEEPAARPFISDVVMTLSFLSIPEPILEPVHIPTPEPNSSRCSSSEYSEESEHSSDDEH